MSAMLFFRILIRASSIVICCSWAISLCGQAAAPGTSFTSSAELVTIPVVVTDKSGKHITKLAKEDFAVLQDGREQKVAVFEEVQRPTEPATRIAVQKNVFSNLLPGNTAPRQLTLLVLDLINTPFAEQAKARRSMLEFLQESIDRGQLTALLEVLPRGTKVVSNFTADPAVLAAALKKLNGSVPDVQITPRAETISDDSAPSDRPNSVGDLADFAEGKQNELQEALEAFETRVAITMTMKNLQSIARAYGGLPGRKALIWVSAGFPFSVSPPQVTINRRRTKPQVDTVESVLPLYDQTWKDLNQAQISVYTVDVRGLGSAAFVDASKRLHNANQTYLPSQQWLNSEINNTCRTFASETGGISFCNTNDFKGAFEQSADDNAHYYLLGYYLDRRAGKPGWHRLSVKVSGPGSEVRARNGFFVAKSMNDPAKEAQIDIQNAFASPMDYTAIPITTHWVKIQPGDAGKKKAIFAISTGPDSASVDSSDSNHLVVDIAAAAIPAAGAPAAVTSQSINDHLKPEGVETLRKYGINFEGFLAIAPGKYTVRFVVRDRLTGRMGSVSAPLNIQ